jgi:hypothetical protein
MSNTLLTIDQITRKSLVVLHQKLNFIGNIDRQHEASFGNEGRQIGETIRIRLPNQFTVRTGQVWSAPAITEQSVNLTVNRYRGVDMNFSDQDFALRIEDFTARHIDPAMSVLAAHIENDAMSMLNSVYQVVNNVGATIGTRQVGQARKLLTDALAPSGDRTLIMNTQDNLDYIDAVKGLFQDSTSIAKQYREGMTGRSAGFDVYENTLIPTPTTGTALSATTYTVNGANQTGSGVIVATGSTTFAVGDVVTFAGCFRVHPETKQATGDLQQFVVTAAYAGGAGTLAIAPAIVTSGARQNVSASPTNGGAVVKVGGASAVYRPSVAFHRDAFTFATADLPLPKGTDMASRKVMDGISMRMIRDFDSVNARFITRLDVLYGYTAQRPELAARILSN